VAVDVGVVLGRVPADLARVHARVPPLVVRDVLIKVQ
jgi:hypothetical protein